MNDLLQGSWWMFPRPGMMGGPGGKSAGRKVLMMNRMTQRIGMRRRVPTRVMENGKVNIMAVFSV